MLESRIQESESRSQKNRKSEERLAADYSDFLFFWLLIPAL
jgi:hypothetical protein